MLSIKMIVKSFIDFEYLLSFKNILKGINQHQMNVLQEFGGIEGKRYKFNEKK